ncbi:Spy/CpxP family protein refolding chaperone [Limimaricola sp. G21655-S1]|uniref:Spy/CpxP family protein refolding chaperone n=1 Tax=Limimaricola sp. G21655-S1 TaxID=3014768 RepID=UPI0022AFB430|nr:Spy/CpxP family protein refolding chaperone [Limimaricola sp. G21655-S1]MCZ4260074.1 Spy/CpxP family protein refolding chaperone [Limimaricola sp. G21655-S1]
MRHNKTVLLAAAAAAAAALLTAPAAAQQQMQGGMQQGMQSIPGMMQGQGMLGQMKGGRMMGNMGGHMMGDVSGQMMGGGPAIHLEGRLAFLKTELGVTGAQMDVWQDYAAAVRNSVGSMQEMHEMMMSGDWPTSFPERMERHEQMMSARIETLTKLREAAVPLYEALDDEQKQMADRIMGMGMGMM